MSDKESQKEMAARAALAEIKTDQVLGIGSGSTVEYFIKLLREEMLSKHWNILAVPTSYQTAFLCIQNRIPLTTLNEHPELDIAIDGADEIDSVLNCIKGGGAALTQEKIVDSMAKKFIIIADESKQVKKLGEKMAIPIEILPMSFACVSKRLKAYSYAFKLREAVKKLGPVITDNGNFIIDAQITDIQNPKQLELKIKGIPGVVEIGLFIDMANLAYIGTKTGLKKLAR
ncbi:MAG: ribose 5-phosphate isomerase A [Candidatus Helarchaeota archaeon]|nr:ribose 5-phosphate isomerase A [Candidatus Helarchaeota archaeon]